MPPIDPLQQQHHPMYQNFQQSFEDLREPRFQPAQSQNLYDYYRRNVNSQIFNQRSRSHQSLDQNNTMVKQQYAKILDFQVKEQMALKARKKSQEKSLSPQQKTFFDKFGLTDPKLQEHVHQEKQRYLRDTLKQQIEEKAQRKEIDAKEKERQEMQLMRIIEHMNKSPARSVAENMQQYIESIPIPITSARVKLFNDQYLFQQINQDDYKALLLQQIEDKKRTKESEKKKKIEEDIKDEQRVMREMQEMNTRFKIETGVIKPEENQKSRSRSISDNEQKFDNDPPQTYEYQNQGHISNHQPQQPLYNPYHQVDPFISEEQQLMQIDYNNGHEQLDPMKRQLQATLDFFKQDIVKLQRQHNEMMKSMKSNKESVISDMKSNHEKELKKQIQQLQKTVEQLQKQKGLPSQSINHKQQKSTNHKPNPSITSNDKHSNNTYQNQSPSVTQTVNSVSNFSPQKLQEFKLNPHKIDKDEVQKQIVELRQQFEEEEIESTDENKQQQLMPAKYNNDKQIIKNSNTASLKNTPQQLSTKSFQKQAAPLKKQSIAQMMQGTPESRQFEEDKQESLKSKRSLSRHKMQSVISSSPSKEIVTPYTNTNKSAKLPAKLPPKQQSKAQSNTNTFSSSLASQQNQQQLQAILPKNIDNEVLSITNLINRSKSIDRGNEQENRNENNGSSPSILKKQSSLQRRLTGTVSSKSVRIQEVSQNEVFIEEDQQQYQEQEKFELPENEFFMGKEQPMITDEIGSEYVQQTRDFEKHYYEDVLKPHKFVENINSHSRLQIEDDDEAEIPEHIGGIKVVGVETSRSQKINLDEQTKVMEKYTNFLFNKNLINQQASQNQNDEEIKEDISDNDHTPQNQPYIDEEEEKKIKEMMQPNNQYTLGENTQNENASFKDYNNSQIDPNMVERMTDIKRIINENSRLSEEIQYQNLQQSNQSYAQFNQNFERNLKTAEYLFEEGHKKSQNSKTNINLSEIQNQNEDSNPIHLSQIPPINYHQQQLLLSDNMRKSEDSLNQAFKNIPNFLNSAARSKQNNDQSDDKIFMFQDDQENKFELIKKPQEQNAQQIIKKHQTINDKMIQDQLEYEDNDLFRLVTQENNNFSNLQKPILESYRQSPINQQVNSKVINNQAEVQPPSQQFNIMSMLQKTNNNNQQVYQNPQFQHTQSEFTHFNNLSSQTPKHFSKEFKNQQNNEDQNSDQHIQIQQQSRNANKVQLINKSMQVSDRMNQYNMVKVQSPKSGEQPLNSQQSLKKRQINEDNPNAKKPPLPMIYQQKAQLQNALTTILEIDDQNQVQKDESSIINVFSENSMINEKRPHLNIYNPYFNTESPANKIYDKNDPFLINLNLRQKLSETNQMIHVDNQNLLDKIKQLGKSIKPVNYGYPFIDLTKPDYDQTERDHIQNRGEIYAAQLKNSMNELNSHYRPPSIIDLAQSTKSSNSPNMFKSSSANIIRYLNYNFNGERGMDLKQKIQSSIDSKKKVESKESKLLKYAETYNNQLVSNMVKDKIYDKKQTIPQVVMQTQQKKETEDPKLNSKQLLQFLQNQNKFDHQQTWNSENIIQMNEDDERYFQDQNHQKDPLEYYSPKTNKKSQQSIGIQDIDSDIILNKVLENNHNSHHQKQYSISDYNQTTSLINNDLLNNNRQSKDSFFSDSKNPHHLKSKLTLQGQVLNIQQRNPTLIKSSERYCGQIMQQSNTLQQNRQRSISSGQVSIYTAAQQQHDNYAPTESEGFDQYGLPGDFMAI